MTGTVIPNLTDISLCEAVGSWTGTPTPTLQDPLIYTAKQGTYCIQSYNAGAAARSARWDFGATSGFWKNFSGQFLYSWFAFSMKDYTTGTGIITIRLTDGVGKNREWDIFNKTTLPHIGWIGWCIHADYGYDRQDSGFDITTIRYVGWLLADSAKGKVYIYYDAWRYGTGLGIKFGTEGSPAVFEDFYTSELTNAYGVVDKIASVYFIKGQIVIGSLTIDESTYFKDLNQVVVFQDIKGTPSGVYEIKGQRATTGSGTTKIFFGTKSGTAGISGCFIRASSTMMWKLTMSNTNISEFGFYGCTFVYADSITGQAYSTTKEFLSTNFIASLEMVPDTGIVKSCNFISSPSSAIQLSSISHNITDSSFISCQRAIHITVAGPFSFNNLDFLTNTYDGYNTSGVSITVNYDSYCSPAPSSYDPVGNAIIFQTSITLTIRKVKTGIEPSEYVRCSIYKKTPFTEIMNRDADVVDDQNPTYYKASTTYTATGIVVIIRARRKGYLPFEIELTIPSTGLDVTAVWLVDPNYQV